MAQIQMDCKVYRNRHKKKPVALECEKDCWYAHEGHCALEYVDDQCLNDYEDEED